MRYFIFLQNIGKRVGYHFVVFLISYFSACIENYSKISPISIKIQYRKIDIAFE